MYVICQNDMPNALSTNRCPSWSCSDGAVALTVDHWCGSQMLRKLVSMGKVPKTRKLWPKVGPFHFPIRTFGVFVNLYELGMLFIVGFCRFRFRLVRKRQTLHNQWGAAHLVDEDEIGPRTLIPSHTKAKPQREASLGIDELLWIMMICRWARSELLNWLGYRFTDCWYHLILVPAKGRVEHTISQ